MIAGGDLIDASRREIRDEHVQPPVVVEPGQAFGGVRFVQIPGDDDRIAGRVRRFRPRHRRHERDAPAVGRPRDRLARAGKRRVGAGHLGDEARAAPVRSRHGEPHFVADAPAIGDPLPIRRPFRIADGSFSPPNRVLLPSASVNTQSWPYGRPGPSLLSTVYRDAGRVGRQLYFPTRIASSAGRRSTGDPAANAPDELNAVPATRIHVFALDMRRILLRIADCGLRIADRGLRID